MKKILVGIVEDEVIIANNIINSLTNLGYDTVGPALNYSQGVEMLQESNPDILLLDIILAGNKDGIDLAWEIRENYDLPFIFLTSHADRATIERAKQVDPPAYLVKPFNKDELYSAIEIALFNYSRKKSVKTLPEIENKGIENHVIKDAIFIKHKNCFKKTKFSEIIYLKNDNIYIDVVTANGETFTVRSNMTDFLSKFPANFYRTHRSFVVNTEFIESIGTDHIIIQNDTIPLSRNYRDDLLVKINIG